MHAVRGFSLLALLLLGLTAPALAAGPMRSIATNADSDYFGFDLRTEKDISLDQCKSVCLGDNACRAFTYNPKAKWCFLKSDFSTLKPFAGAVAGKVVSAGGEPDIGAPGELAFLPAWIGDEALAYLQKIGGQEPAESGEGLNALVAAGDAASASDARAATEKYAAALAIAPEDSALWTKLARAALAVPPVNGEDRDALAQAATSAALNGYLTSRTAAARASALAALAPALEARNQSRPAIAAYEASLALVSDAAVQAAYLDLKARKGFRIVEHTVDSDSRTPRVCAQFSEPLVKAGTDYASFVTVDAAAPKAVTARDREICVEGLGHGRRYRVVFRAGLPAAIGEVLQSPVALDVYVRDRSPAIRFTGENFVLPGTARRGIPLVSVNTSSADLELYRIGERGLAPLVTGYQFLQQIAGYDAATIAEESGEKVWSGKLDIETKLNEEIVTSFPVDEALPKRQPGIYVLTATPAGERETYEARATQWFVVSDIGLATYAGQDGLNVFARSLQTAKPLAGVELQLVAKNNEVLGTAKTGSDGRAAFTAGLSRGEGGMLPAVVTARLAGDDFVFLDLTKAGFDLSDRGVTGRAAPGALDVFAYTERGIYRAGETVHAAALARDDASQAVENLPLTFVFTRPDGVEDRRIVSDGAALGGRAVELPLPPNAMRGTWQMRIHTDPKKEPVASAMFLVEDFVPDRIEFDLAGGEKVLIPGETATVKVDGRFLYGAPASGLSLEGEVNLKTVREREGFPGYLFGLAEEEQEDSTSVELEDLPVTDEEGKAEIEVALDQLPSTTRFLDADIVVRMREGAGRAVERRIELPVRPDGARIGIRPAFSGGQVAENSTARFSVVAIDADGKRLDMPGLVWSLIKIERNYQWYRSGGSWNYEPVEFTRKVADGRLDAAAGGEAQLAEPVEWGRYRLTVESAAADGPATSVDFNAGWYVAASSTETPDALEIALDKQSYRAGETARLKLSPRFAGEVLVTVGAERLLATTTATVPAEGATIDLPVAADWGAGTYVTATLYRPGDSDGASRLPQRAIGVTWLKIDPGERRLDVALEAPAKMLPRETLTVPVKLAGLAAGEDAYVTVAAVDVGILNLTRYAAPDPEGWYFGQRRLGLELRDLYGRLIDGSAGATGRLRTGGDGAQMASEGSPPTQKLVAFFSGPVKVDGEGRATVAFDIPQFNGTVRVMAVAWSKKAVGHASADVIVRDPVVVTAGLPRFMAPGDRATLRLDIANTDGPAGDYALAVEAGGAVTAAGDTPKTVHLAAGERKAVIVPIKANAAGNAGITLTLAHAGGTAVEQVLALPVRPATLPLSTRRIVGIPANGSLRVDGELLADSRLDGASVSVGVSASAAFDVPSLLMTLDRYPYGCAEQTTSRALPLLYVGELSAAAGLEGDPDLKKRVQDAIYRVLSYQSSSGSFGMWGPGSGDLWLDAYVTDFLTRAREQAYDVPAAGLRQALDNLQNSLAYDVDIKGQGTEIAYALYVLARNHRASVGDLRYYADTQIDAFSSPMARAQIGASLALYGDSQRSERAFASALGLAASDDAALPDSRSDYGSKLRDGAAILALAAETKPAPSIIPAAIRMVASERTKRLQATRATSTQEEAWLLLAARAIRAGAGAIALDIDGVAHEGAFATRIEGAELAAHPLVIANRGGEPVEAVVTTVAAPKQPLPAGGDGFSITRTYYTLDGEEANVSEARQNERYVVVLRATENNAWPSRVLVTDLLPAGFEIDNPALVGSAELANFDWLGSTEAAHVEFRDDRFVAAFDRTAQSDRDMTLAYVVRAVTPGVYAHPAASIEDMYRPGLSARTATASMEVKAAD